MATSSSTCPPPETPQTINTSSNSENNNNVEVNRELEQMTEYVENMSVQLTWMAYDMVALRTNPQLFMSMRKLKNVSQKCKAAVLGEQIPETDERPNAEQ